MKSTKRILSAILSVVMILGCLTVGFTAQASAADLVALVAQGGEVSWTGGNVTLDDTLVIDGDVTVDFNGAVITGPAGKVAIRVDSGDVTLYDGVVLADQGSYSGETGFVKALMNYKPAISINDGNVELNCITAVGSLLRIPNSGTIEVPIGNGINANGGNVTIDNVIAIGMKALDNTKANVVVKDAILAGIYKAVNIYSQVDFGDDYVQYETVELLEGFLNEGVTLTANEKKYIASATNSQGDFSVGSVIVNVAKPDFNAPTTTYVDGKLNVFSVVEQHEHEGVSNRYSYSYTPDTVTIDGEEKEFVVDGALYVASFEVEQGDYEAEINYDLSVKLGKKQKEIVEDAFEIVEHYIDKAPELLNRFIEDFEHIYETAEDLVALVYNAYYGTTSATTVKSIDGIEDIMALIYALEGQNFAGSDEGVVLHNALYTKHYAKLNSDYSMHDYSVVENAVKTFINSEKTSWANSLGTIFDTDGDGAADSIFAYTYDNTFEKAATFEESEFAKGTPGYGAGKGLLEVFNEYYETVLDLLYVDGSTTEFAADGVEKAAAYIGANWEGIYELVENAVVVLDKANELLDSGVFENVLDKLNKGAFKSYLSAFDTAYKYVNKIMGRVDEALDSNFVNTYLKDADTAANYCGKYAKKVWNIVNNPETYFDINVDGDYVVVDLADDSLNETYTLSAAVKPVHVTVSVSGAGAAKLNDFAQTNSYSRYFAYGEDIVVEPVETAEGSSFSYMVVKSGGNSTVVDGGTFTAKAATNLEIEVVFKNPGADPSDATVVFMTDKALNYKYIAAAEDSVDAIGENWDAHCADAVAPTFAGLEFKGWALDKDAETGADVKTLGAEVAAAAAESDVVIVYAIYEYDEKVEVETQDEVIKMTNYEVIDGKGYFEVNIQLKGAQAIEAGVILTMTESLATEDAMNITLSGEEGVIFARTSKVTDGYVNQNVQYTAGVAASGRVYARGYVVYADGTADYTEIVYLDI